MAEELEQEDEPGSDRLIKRELARLIAAIENTNRRYVTPQALPVALMTMPTFNERDGAIEMSAEILCTDGLVYPVVATYHADERLDGARLMGPGHPILSESFDE